MSGWGLLQVEQLGTLRWFPDGDLPVEGAAAEQLREFFDEWRHELISWQAAELVV